MEIKQITICNELFIYIFVQNNFIYISSLNKLKIYVYLLNINISFQRFLPYMTAPVIIKNLLILFTNWPKDNLFRI